MSRWNHLDRFFLVQRLVSGRQVLDVAAFSNGEVAKDPPCEHVVLMHRDSRGEEQSGYVVAA